MDFVPDPFRLATGANHFNPGRSQAAPFPVASLCCENLDAYKPLARSYSTFLNSRWLAEGCNNGSFRNPHGRALLREHMAWNVLTLNPSRHWSLLSCELSRLKDSIAGIQEVRWTGHGEQMMANTVLREVDKTITVPKV